MKYIALAKTVLVTIWLRQVVAREDGIRGMNSNTNQEEVRIRDLLSIIRIGPHNKCYSAHNISNMSLFLLLFLA